MSRETWAGAGLCIALCVIWWVTFTAEKTSVRITQSLDAAPELRLVSEQSPYMRNER